MWLPADSELRSGQVHIEVQLLDRHQSGEGAGGEGGLLATQALSAEQLAQLRAQLPPGVPLPGISNSSISPGFPPMGSSPNNPSSSSILPGAYPQAAPLPSLPQAWLTIRLPQMAQKVYHIEKPVVNIGRQLTNDIIVEDKRVSRYHAQIKYKANGQFAIFDLGSTNGITINGTPHLPHHPFPTAAPFTSARFYFYFH